MPRAEAPGTGKLLPPVNVGEVVRDRGDTENTRVTGNVIWEKVGKLELENKLGIF